MTIKQLYILCLYGPKCPYCPFGIANTHPASSASRFLSVLHTP